MESTKLFLQIDGNLEKDIIQDFKFRMTLPVLAFGSLQNKPSNLQK